MACSPETHKESEHRDLAKTGNLNQPVSSPILNDTSPPVLSLIETPLLDGSNIISFGFRSSEPGKIRYSGSCIGSTTNALKGDHHIKFVAMVEGTYDDCALQVTDASGNKSAPLQVPAFTVDFTAPELTAGMGATPRVVGRTAAMSLHASEPGTLAHDGNCGGSPQQITQGQNKVLIRFPGDGQFSDCELTLKDTSGNTSEPLALGTVRIDATPPVLVEVHPVSKIVKSDRPSYSFKTSKSEILNFSGKCKGNVEQAVAGVNHIALLTNEPGAYDDCSLTLTDFSNNRSLPLKISSFVVAESS